MIEAGSPRIENRVRERLRGGLPRVRRHRLGPGAVDGRRDARPVSAGRRAFAARTRGRRDPRPVPGLHHRQLQRSRSGAAEGQAGRTGFVDTIADRDGAPLVGPSGRGKTPRPCAILSELILTKGVPVSTRTSRTFSSSPDELPAGRGLLQGVADHSLRGDGAARPGRARRLTPAPLGSRHPLQRPEHEVQPEEDHDRDVELRRRARPGVGRKRPPRGPAELSSSNRSTSCA